MFQIFILIFAVAGCCYLRSSQRGESQAAYSSSDEP
jgi:hypothetical protein